MSSRRSERHNARGIARRIAAFLIRSREAPYILDDLHELFARDLERGMGRPRAWLRYWSNVFGSAITTGGARWPRIRVPGVSWLDVKLGLRMLRKHPGLSLVSGVALAIGIPVALAPLQLADALNRPLPFPESRRVVGIEFWDRVDSKAPGLRDFELWREELASFQALAAQIPTLLNVADENDRSEAVLGSEIAASAFDILRVRPYLGRPLLESDEAVGAPDVVVLGYDIWQARFGGDSAVVGRSVRLGEIERVVVGVMPAGFQFPNRDAFWLPLREKASDYEWGAGPGLLVFGRLSEGVSRTRAQAEARTVASRVAAEHPETHGGLRADVLPLPWVISGLQPTLPAVGRILLVTVLLLLVTCGNIGTLTVAKTASRSSEIAIRSALGAGRGRIIGQLFVEALVLAMVAAAVGLGLAEIARRAVLAPLEQGMPYWFDLGLRPRTFALAAGFAILSAVVTGVIPAIRGTGRNVQRTLQRTAAGVSGMRFGAVATVLIVAEVGLAVGCLSVVATTAHSALRDTSRDFGIAPAEYLSVQLRIAWDRPVETEEDRQAVVTYFSPIEEEIVRRLSSEPGVLGVAVGDRLPGMDHPRYQVEVDGLAPPPGTRGYQVSRGRVQPGFFEALGRPVISGRSFESSDLGDTRPAVIVNESFADQVLRGLNSIGQRIRYVHDPGTEPGPWYEVVGVVPDLGMNVSDAGQGAGIYRPLAPGEVIPARLAIHLSSDPASFTPKLREVVTSVDPGVMLANPRPLDQVFSERLWQTQFTGFVFALIAVIAVVLSAVGHYALVAFTVSERTREIAIRMTLGAHRRRIVGVIVRRAVTQLGVGVLLGVWVGASLLGEYSRGGTAAHPGWPALLAAVAAVMMATGLLACAGPTRRALKIQPSRALGGPG